MVDSEATTRVFAIIPAAGFSRRMGAAKLLLKWNGKPVIDHVLAAWTRSCVTQTVVIVRRSDQELAEACSRWPVAVVQPAVDPPDMKASVQAGLRLVEALYVPRIGDRWLLAPADLPRLTSDVVNRVAQTDPEGERIVIPYVGQRRGHPVSFPWRFARNVFTLSDDQGINVLTKQGDPLMLPLDDARVFDDLDTPDDLRRLQSSDSDA